MIFNNQHTNNVAIMQPYFLPYIGYFQLISAVDVFVLYDNIKYTKKGWINRNRLLLNNQDAIFSLPLKKGADSLFVAERFLSDDFKREKLLAQFLGAYVRAPYFQDIRSLLSDILLWGEPNLFEFIRHALSLLCQYLGIHTEIRISSSILIDHGLKGEEKVIAICKELGACRYINAIGGLSLYDQRTFKDNGIDLKFIQSQEFIYRQFSDQFVPWLSIIDVLMFNSLDVVREQISSNYRLI